MKNKLLLSVALIGLSFASVNIFAASFQSLEQSAAKLGTANSGTAVDSDDASIQFYNPAAMTKIERPKIAVSGILVAPNINFEPVDANTGGVIPVYGSNKSPARNDVLPSFYYVQPIDKRLVFGFGVEVPYGLETHYDNDSIARYIATKSHVDAINLNPSVGFKITNNFSLGIGMDIEHLKAEIDQNIPLVNFAVENDAKDWGYGWNAGAFYQFSPQTSFGLAYHSRIDHHLEGQRTIITPLHDISVADATSDITLPDTATLSMQHQVNDRWQILADLQYTHWNILDKIVLNFASPVFPQATLPFNYHDSFRLALGQKYKVNDKFLFRAGLAFDQTPADKAYLSARIPDANRYWLSLGANYKFNKHVNLDLGYSLIIFGHSEVHQKIPLPDPFSSITTNLDAHYKAFAHIAGLQLNIDL